MTNIKNLNGLQLSLMTNKTRGDFSLPPISKPDISIHPHGRKGNKKAKG